ncbi:hypothetical protein [Burkholderia sp. NLJ2]|uniref:hypothetical protein n=1 Tax=Burkholderia sp. NLJ2 TaxID=3090699 RepID=UPI003C6C2725
MTDVPVGIAGWQRGIADRFGDDKPARRQRFAAEIMSLLQEWGPRAGRGLRGGGWEAVYVGAGANS